MNDLTNSWPDYATSPALYSADPAERYAASMKFAEHSLTKSLPWPHGCRGAANAWLVLLGPSPGKRGATEAVVPSSQNNRIWDYSSGIGQATNEIRFSDGKQRNPRFEKISHAGFGTHSDSDMPKKLTALVNLDGDNATYGNQRVETKLSSGCELVFDLLLEARPRIVIVLSLAAWSPFSAFLQSKGARPFSAPPVLSNGRSLMAQTIKLTPELPFSTLFVKSRQHPSMPFFKVGVDDEAIRKTVDSFLAQSL